jgi:thiol-disulfide isomerase/thioredoxin
MHRLIPIFWGAAFLIASAPMWRPCPPCAGSLCIVPPQRADEAGIAKPSDKTPPPAIPESRGGRDVLGKSFPLDGLHWVEAVRPVEETRPAEAERANARPARVTLLRWWTDECGYCERSLPALEKLRHEFGKRGLDVIAVYHPKPPRDVRDEDVIAWANEFGFHGRLAVDRDWGVLRRSYLSKARRSATSASFVLGSKGNVRFVHPGPVFGPSDDPSEARPNQDYEDLRAAIEALLADADE